MALSKVCILVVVTAAVVACGTSAGDSSFAEAPSPATGDATGTLGSAGSGTSESCAIGATRSCDLGDAGTGACTWGTRTCVASGEFSMWGACTDAGGCGTPATESTESGAKLPPGENPGELKMNIDVKGDCVCAPACPPNAPFVIGCNVTFEGSNSNGCVATAKDGKTYFQEGVKCDEGHLSGYIACSSTPGPGLNAQNCPINKSDPHYASKPSSCPDISNNSTPDKCYF